MKHRTGLTALLLASTIVLAACQANDSERPQLDNYESVSAEPEPSIDVPAGTPGLHLADVSPGGSYDQDPLWRTVAQAADSGEEAYLDVVVHVDGELPETEQVALTPDTPDSVTVTVDSAAISAETAPFYRITGTFTAESIGESAFILTTVNTDTIDGLIPDGETTEQRCTAADAQDRVGSAVEELAGNADTRESLRTRWLNSPELWWGIQRSAQSLVDTNGEVEGDFLSIACEPYL